MKYYIFLLTQIDGYYHFLSQIIGELETSTTSYEFFLGRRDFFMRQHILPHLERLQDWSTIIFIFNNLFSIDNNYFI